MYVNPLQRALYHYYLIGTSHSSPQLPLTAHCSPRLRPSHIRTARDSTPSRLAAPVGLARGMEANDRAANRSLRPWGRRARAASLLRSDCSSGWFQISSISPPSSHLQISRLVSSFAEPCPPPRAHCFYLRLDPLPSTTTFSTYAPTRDRRTTKARRNGLRLVLKTTRGRDGERGCGRPPAKGSKEALSGPIEQLGDSTSPRGRGWASLRRIRPTVARDAG